jgi:AcrR family transcriptional regulator
MSNATERNIYDAALRLFAKKGFEGTGIREIADAAGVTTSTLYHYMGSKDDLLIAIMQTGMQALQAGAGEVLVRHEDPRVQLGGIVKVHVWVHGVRQLATRVTDTEVRSITGDARAEVLARRDAYEEVWRDVVRRGLEADLFAVRNARLAATALLSMCTGVAQWYRADGAISLDDICDDHAEWALSMVGADRDAWRALSRDIGHPTVYYQAPDWTETQVASQA